MASFTKLLPTFLDPKMHLAGGIAGELSTITSVVFVNWVSGDYTLEFG